MANPTQQQQYGQVANYNISPGARGDGQSSALEVDQYGNLKITQSTTDYAFQYAVNSGTSTTFYIGQAPMGSLTSAAVWQIQQITIASGVQIEWANSNDNFNNIWDNRESLTYG